MSETLQHLQKLKSRLSQTQTKPEEMSASEKVEKLEKALSVFRTEVDMKLQIMQQILTTRNDQVTIQKKLLEKEQTLYDTLLVHWINTPKLAATGLSVNFSAADVNTEVESTSVQVQPDVEAQDNDMVENQSDPDYAEGDDIIRGPTRKKSRSSLRRQRQSSHSTRKSNIKKEELVDVYEEPHVQVEIGITEDDGGSDDGGVDNDFTDFFEHVNRSGTVDHDQEEDIEAGNETSRLEYLEYPNFSPDRNTNAQNVSFATTETRDGRKLDLKLPQSLISQIQSATKERTIALLILKHFYSVQQLMTSTLTGNSKKGSLIKQKALPQEMVILIQEAVKKYLPPTKSPNTEAGRKLIADQKQRVRIHLTRILQYFKDKHNEDGTIKETYSKKSGKRKADEDDSE